MPDREDPPHPDPARGAHELAVGGLADAEMGVRVDHARGV